MLFFPVSFGGHQCWMQPVRVKQEYVVDHFIQPIVPRSSGHYHKRDSQHSSGSSVGPGSFPCTKCGKVYNWRGNLLRHMRLECGKDPQFFCNSCAYKTHRKENLCRHYFFIHKIDIAM